MQTPEKAEEFTLITVHTESRKLVEHTTLGDVEYTRTLIVKKQTWNDNIPLFGGKSYKLTYCYRNGSLTDLSSQPWRD